jgi:hypothetical protein
VASGLQSTAMQLGGTLGTAILGAVMSAKISSLLPASWAAAHLPALNPDQLAGAKSAVSVGVAPVTSSTPPRVAAMITQISHDTFVSGMHTAFLVAAVVTLAGAPIALITRRAPPRAEPTPASDWRSSARIPRNVPGIRARRYLRSWRHDDALDLIGALVDLDRVQATT